MWLIAALMAEKFNIRNLALSFGESHTIQDKDSVPAVERSPAGPLTMLVLYCYWPPQVGTTASSASGSLETEAIILGSALRIRSPSAFLPFVKSTFTKMDNGRLEGPPAALVLLPSFKGTLMA